jgi:hypothetical protein
LTGFQPEGGHTFDLIKDILKSELEGHIIIKANLKIEYNASVFH